MIQIHNETSRGVAHRDVLIELMVRSSMASFAYRKIATRILGSTRRRSVRLVVFAMILCAAHSSNAFGQKPTDLVGGIVSRSAAIASGRLAYTFKSESFAGDRALSPVALPEAIVSFSNSSWAERTKGSHKVQINHNGYFLEFVQTPQRDGSVRPGATLYPQRSLESRREFNAPPIFAGSFWHREQLRYVEQHGKDSRIIGQTVVNAIPVTVLELPVAAENHRDAFHVVLPALKSGGNIRLYVAPQLGFVMPRIEFLTPSKQIAQSYAAASFSEVAPGIYFPDRLWTETHAAGGASRYRGEFSVRCELINRPIPQEDFVVDLPVGTRIQDAHEPGSVIKFDLTEASSSGKLPALSSISESVQPIGFFDRWRNAVILGIVIGTVTSISFLIAARDQRHRV